MASQPVSLQNLPHLQVNFQEIANASDRKMILYRVAQVVSYVALLAITGGILAIVLGIIPITLPIWLALPTLIAPIGLFWLADKCQAKVDAHREIRDINRGMADVLNGLDAIKIAQFVLTLKEQKMKVFEPVDPRLIAAYKYWENRALGLLQTANPTPAQKPTENIVALELATNRDLANVLSEHPQITTISAQQKALYREKAAQALVQAAVALENIIHPEKHLRVDPNDFVELSFAERQAQIAQGKPQPLLIRRLSPSAEIVRLRLDQLIPDPQSTLYFPPHRVHRLLFPSLPAHALN